MTARSWKRVSRRRPCPICQKPDWCLVAADGSAVICPRTLDGSVKRCGGAGYLHRLRDADGRRRGRTRTIHVTAVPVPRADLSALAEGYQRGVNDQALGKLAADLGVSLSSLQLLRVGWDGEAWTFPMLSATGAISGILGETAGARS